MPLVWARVLCRFSLAIVFEWCERLATEWTLHFYARICLSRDVISPLIGSHMFTYYVPVATRSVNKRGLIGLADARYVTRHNAFPW